MNLKLYQVKELQRQLGVEADGVWGKISSAAFDRHFKISAPETRYPQESDAIEFYGQPGTGLTLVTVPAGYNMVAAWDPNMKITEFSCHRRCAPDFQTLLEWTLEHFGAHRVAELGLNQYGGCYNKRPKRGGKSWSMHAFAAALDLDPDNNGLRTSAPEARFSRREYLPFWNMVESLGLVSLGRERNYDWMHIQAATL